MDLLEQLTTICNLVFLELSTLLAFRRFILTVYKYCLECDSNNENVLYLEFDSLVGYLRMYPSEHLIVASFHANYKNARRIIVWNL